MVTSWDVYRFFREAQGLSTGKPYRLPKCWETQQAKMTKVNLDALERVTGYFNTTYSNVDVLEYMKCGFELFKNFTYTMMLKNEVIQLYITKDKSKKRRIASSKESIDDTFDFITNYLTNKNTHKGYTKLQSFCKFREGEIRDIVDLYNKGKVDQITLIYCINKKYITLNDEEKSLTPYIVQRYRELCNTLVEVKEFIIERERMLNEEN